MPFFNLIGRDRAVEAVNDIDYAIGAIGNKVLFNKSNWKGVKVLYPNIDINKYGDAKSVDALIGKTVIYLERGSDYYGKRAKLRSCSKGGDDVIIRFPNDVQKKTSLVYLYLVPETREEISEEITRMEGEVEILKQRQKYAEDNKLDKIDLDRFEAAQILNKIQTSATPEDEVLKLIQANNN